MSRLDTVVILLCILSWVIQAIFISNVGRIAKLIIGGA